MPRRGENIYKRQDGRWEGRYIKGKVDGKTKYGYVFAKTYKEVKIKLAACKLIENMEGTENYEETTPVPDIYFSKVANEWFVSQKSQWKPASVVKYTNILNSYLLPSFADRKISEISRYEIMSFGEELLHIGGVQKNGLEPKTVTSILSVMKNIFEFAVQTKGYAAVDVRGISVRQKQKPLRILSRAEQQKLGSYLYENLTPCNLGILVCMYTGLRIGEICALKWEDISFEEQYLYVHQTMQRLQIQGDTEAKTEVIISAPKSDCSIRKVPVPDDIFLLLRETRKQGSAFFLTGVAHQYMEPRTLQNHFKAVLKCCNISDATFHTLRHTFATRCVELGFDVKSLSEILGHASVNITLNRYVHPSMELKQKNMNMLSELFAVK